MTVIWAHDTYFVRRDEAVYAHSAFPSSSWQRYLDHFQDLVVIGRDGSRSSTMPRGVRSDRPGVRFCLVPSMHAVTKWIAARRLVREQIRQCVEEADAVIARMPSLNGELAIREAVRAGLPYAIELVACAWGSLWHYGSWKGKVMAPRSFWTTRRMVLRAPYVLYVTEQWLQKRYPTRGYSAAASNVDLQTGGQGITSVNRKTADNDYNRPYLIGTIGYLGSKYKGYDSTIRAVGRLRRKGYDVVLRILGQGDPRPWQECAEENGVRDSVVFDGTRLPGVDVNDWIDELDLYVQPSLAEGLPRAVIEAMARARPIVATRVGGMSEILDSSALVPRRNSAALAEAIERAINEEEWSQEQAMANLSTSQRFVKPHLDEVRREFFNQLVVDAASRRRRESR